MSCAWKVFVDSSAETERWMTRPASVVIHRVGMHEGLREKGCSSGLLPPTGDSPSQGRSTVLFATARQKLRLSRARGSAVPAVLFLDFPPRLSQRHGVAS